MHNIGVMPFIICTILCTRWQDLIYAKIIRRNKHFIYYISINKIRNYTLRSRSVLSGKMKTKTKDLRIKPTSNRSVNGKAGVPHMVFFQQDGCVIKEA